MGWGKLHAGPPFPAVGAGAGTVRGSDRDVNRRRVALILGGLAVVAGSVLGVLVLTHGPAEAPATSGGPGSPDGEPSTTAAPEEAPPSLDPGRLRTLLPTVADLAGRYSGGKFTGTSASAVRRIEPASAAVASAKGVLGGVEQVFDAYNPYYQSDTTVVFRVLLFGSRDEAAAFVRDYDKPSRVDNVTTRDSVAVSTFEYQQAGRFPTVAESMAATGHVVVWVKIVDSDALSIYTGVAYLMVEDAVVEAIDSFAEVAAAVTPG